MSGGLGQQSAATVQGEPIQDEGSAVLVIVADTNTEQDAVGETEAEDDKELLEPADDVRGTKIDSEGDDVAVMAEETASVPVFVIVPLADTDQDGDGETDPDEDVDSVFTW